MTTEFRQMTKRPTSLPDLTNMKEDGHLVESSEDLTVGTEISFKSTPSEGTKNHEKAYHFARKGISPSDGECKDYDACHECSCRFCDLMPTNLESTPDSDGHLDSDSVSPTNASPDFAQQDTSHIIRQRLSAYLKEPSAIAIFALSRQRTPDVGTSKEFPNVTPSLLSLSGKSLQREERDMPVDRDDNEDEKDLSDNTFQELHFPDELILEELNEMRLILQNLLEQYRDLALITSPLTADDDIVSTLLGVSLRSRGYDTNRSSLDSINAVAGNSTNNGPSSSDVPTSFHKEPFPHFPVGSSGVMECGVCLETSWMFRRACCSYPVCGDCLTSYFSSKIELGLVSIECINTKCKDFVHRDEISVRLPTTLKPVYYRLVVNSNADELSKTCPRCNYVLTLESSSQLKNMKRFSTKDPSAVRVECVQCGYLWCFPCSSPWHEGITCKQYIKGDRLLHDWARKVSQGQVNAQKCPKCRILIQKSSGCDHMHCTRCKTDFCYRCGDTLRRLKFFGDHYSKLSIFGCKYRYKASQPIQRKLIRGAVFGSKLMMAPVLGSLALIAGAVVIGVGVAALPLYGGLRLYRKYQHLALADNTKVSSRNSSKSVISTGAQTVQVTFIGDHYIDDFESTASASF